MNNKKSILLLLIILISAYHFKVHNRLEKMFTKAYFSFNDIKRPLKSCDNFNNFGCVGMPSGHAEGSSVLGFLLYFYNFIPLWACVTFIVLVCIQRVITSMHTIIQVLMGGLLGFIYASIYKQFNLSINVFLIIFGIGLILKKVT